MARMQSLPALLDARLRAVVGVDPAVLKAHPPSDIDLARLRQVSVTDYDDGAGPVPLSEDEIRWKGQGTATYQDLTRRCLATLHETVPLTAVEPDRKRIEMPDVVPLVATRNREQ